MIFTLTIECVFGIDLREPCTRVLEISDGTSLLSLHLAIQKAIGLDEDWFRYFIANRLRGRRQWLSEAEGWEGRIADYRRIKLRDVFPVKGGRLHYLLDIDGDWVFEVRSSRQRPKEPEPGVKYPRVVQRIGPDPEPYPDIEF